MNWQKRCNSLSNGFNVEVFNASNNAGAVFSFPYFADFLFLTKKCFNIIPNFWDGLDMSSIFLFFKIEWSAMFVVSFLVYPSFKAHSSKQLNCFKNQASISWIIKNTESFLSSGIIIFLSGCSLFFKLLNHKCLFSNGKSASTKSTIGV